LTNDKDPIENISISEYSIESDTEED